MHNYAQIIIWSLWKNTILITSKLLLSNHCHILFGRSSDLVTPKRDIFFIDIRSLGCFLVCHQNTAKLQVTVCRPALILLSTNHDAPFTIHAFKQARPFSVFSVQGHFLLHLSKEWWKLKLPGVLQNIFGELWLLSIYIHLFIKCYSYIVYIL